jgi:hypothetical protein
MSAKKLTKEEYWMAGFKAGALWFSEGIRRSAPDDIELPPYPYDDEDIAIAEKEYATWVMTFSRENLTSKD